ncbi:MAG: DNA gyrase inhibitor YacG [Burkholderiaceae bacterium]|nr:DNA gyrase inhibitor YacG [Burkholderiaceae bacterium]
MPRNPAVTNARTVRCPACGGPSLYTPANPWRPFCGQRCKQQDLGDWASERFRVQVQEPDGAEDEPPADNGSFKATLNKPA